MRKRRSGWLGAGAAITLIAAGAQVANAQGYGWTGGYIGANIGYVRGQSDARTTVTCPPTGYFCTTTNFHANIGHIQGNGSGSLTDNSVAGGLQAGFNWQIGSLVVGLEADAGSFSLSGARSAGPVAYPTNAAVRYTIGTTLESNVLMTGRARLGLAVSNWLFYATGGLAASDITVTNSMNDSGTLRGGSSATDMKLGWAFGGGVEWAMSRNWTLRGEYLRVDLGTVTTTAIVGTAANNNLLTTNADLAADVVRAAVSYRF